VRHRANRETGGLGGAGRLAEMELCRIDEAGGDDASGELDEMSLRTDERFQISELTVGDDQAAGDRDRVDPGMTEDDTLVQDQVGFPGGGYHFETNAFVASDRTRRRLKF